MLKISKQDTLPIVGWHFYQNQCHQTFAQLAFGLVLAWVRPILVGDTGVGKVQHPRVVQHPHNSTSWPNLNLFCHLHSKVFLTISDCVNFFGGQTCAVTRLKAAVKLELTKTCKRSFQRRFNNITLSPSFDGYL